ASVHPEESVGDPGQGRVEIARPAYRLQFPGHALVPHGVVAFREGGDDGRPVGEVLVERTDRNARAFDDVAHAEGIASLLDQELLCAREDGLEALTAALLRQC